MESLAGLARSPAALAVLFLCVFPNHGPLWLIGEVPVLDWARASVRLLFP